ncbi:MAG: hypothetical protein Q4G69_01260 [Planctomycetia bacterium]|nr:hypothetical protein [Planctomycetia bacterium]
MKKFCFCENRGSEKKEIGSEGILRITITANHTKEMLRILIDPFAQVL